MIAPALALLSLGSTASAATFSLKNSYQGSSFFDSGNAFNFSSGLPNSNAGNALFVDYTQASSSALNLAYVNAAGNAVVKVDNVTNPNGNPNYGRASVNMTSNAIIEQGSLLILDIAHAPSGCSVWPGIYMIGANAVWPSAGEIDIYENVNLATFNQYSLHTEQGCTHPTSEASLMSGTISSTDCFNVTNSNEGCITQEKKSNSFGVGFNGAGGGSIAVRWNSSGIAYYFFSHGSEPSDLSTSSPNPDGWGQPSAFYSNDACSMSQFFGPQTLIVDINICGLFAGQAQVFQNTCSSSGVSNCQDLVKNPAAYNDAYFEFRSIKIFSDGTNSNSTTNSSSSSGTPRSTSPAGASSTPGGANNAAVAVSPLSGSVLVAMGTMLASILAGALML